MRLDVGIVILSAFCAGGLFAYLREVFRLRQLVSSGKIAVAKIVSLEEDSSGSESVTHYMVKYEFMDADGQPRVHEQDLNSKRFFNTLKRGDAIEVLYEPVSKGNSYPVSQINSDIKASSVIAAAILVFWVVMAAFFALS